MAKKTIIIIILMFFICFIQHDIYAEEDNKTILVLNSYHRGLEWTDSMSRSIINNYREYSSRYHVYVEYMDWKNYPTPQNLEHLYENFSYKYKKLNIDLIITTDDAALTFAIEHRNELFSNAPIIFTGVNEKNAYEITDGIEDITGIIEKQDGINTLELAKSIYPNLKNVYILYDESESGIAMGEEVVNELKEYDSDINFYNNQEKELKGIINEINNLPENTVVFISVFYQDTIGSILGFSANAEYIIKNTKDIPFFALYDFQLGTGAIGGSLLSGTLIGNQVLSTSFEVLDGKDINKIPFNYDSSYKKSVDFTTIKKFDIQLGKISKEYEIINKPPSLMDNYSNLVYGTLIFFAILLVFILFQLYYIRKLIYYKKTLEEKNIVLKGLYDELSASEEELHAQYEELIDTHNQLQRTQKELTTLAYNDTLTNLGNRAGLTLCFNNYISNKNIEGAILLADIDDFKHINDANGHIFGDRLIKEVAEKLKEFTDDSIQTFRLGGDEFLILIKNMSEDQVEEFTQKIINTFKTPVLIDESYITISFSIGIACFPRDGMSLNELMRRADIAMYRAKELGKRRYASFTKSMLEALNKRREIEKNLESALENKELTIHYQPQLSLEKDTIWGFEALLRWNSPVLGYVPPLDFINIAEENQLIIPIGDFVLDEACKFIKKMHDKFNKNYVVAINISVVQILQDNFVKDILGTVEKYNLPYNALEIEITESIMMESFEIIYAKLKKLKDKGIRIALDDFGIGYSSLNYIKRLPLTALKIDRSFTQDIEYGESKRELIGSIIGIGKLMKLEVVAEGVETKEQMEYLALHDTDRIQGYYFSKPIAEEEIYSFINNI